MSNLHLIVDVGLCELVRDMEVGGQGLQPAAQLMPGGWPPTHQLYVIIRP